MPRIYLPLTLCPGATLTLPPAIAHRLREVRRVLPGQQITLFNGEGGEFRGVLTAVSRAATTVEIQDFQPIERESPLTITLAQGIARGERMDYTIQKAIELGVHKIVPIAMERSQVKLAASRAERRLDHWQAVVIHACEQCGRNRIPQVAPVMSLAEFAATDQAATRLTLAPNGAHSLHSLTRVTDFSLVVGPEGGLSPSELELLAAHDYHAVRLGPRTLRTETAALVALTVLQTMAGDLLAEPSPRLG